MYNSEWEVSSPKQKLGNEVCNHKWKTVTDILLYQFLGLEEAPQIEYLPRGQSQETTHAENAKVQHTAVCRLCNRIKATNSDVSHKTRLSHKSEICFINVSADPQKCIHLFQRHNMQTDAWKSNDI
jgi:hypothetical protein